MKKYKRLNEVYYNRMSADSVIVRQLIKHSDETPAIDLANLIVNSIQLAFQGKGRKGLQSVFYKSVINALEVITREIS